MNRREWSRIRGYLPVGPTKVHKRYWDDAGNQRVVCRYCRTDLALGSLSQHLRKSSTCRVAQDALMTAGWLKDAGYRVNAGLSIVEQDVLKELGRIVKRIQPAIERVERTEKVAAPGGQAFEIHAVLGWVQDYMDLRPRLWESGLQTMLLAPDIGKPALRGEPPIDPVKWEAYQRAVTEWHRPLVESLLAGGPTEELTARIAMDVLANGSPEKRGLVSRGW